MKSREILWLSTAVSRISDCFANLNAFSHFQSRQVEFMNFARIVLPIYAVFYAGVDIYAIYFAAKKLSVDNERKRQFYFYEVYEKRRSFCNTFHIKQYKLGVVEDTIFNKSVSCYMLRIY
jgi:hypothetical protein